MKVSHMYDILLFRLCYKLPHTFLLIELFFMSPTFYATIALYILGRGPEGSTMHPPHIPTKLYFSEALGCPEYEIRC